MIDSSLRHKLYWYKPQSADDLSKIHYPFLNVGREIAKFISDRAFDKHIGIDVQDYFQTLISTNSQKTGGANGIALTNLGILLEPELSLNVENILLNLSKEYVIIIIWYNEIVNSRSLCWNNTSKYSLTFPEQTIHRLEIQI